MFLFQFQLNELLLQIPRNAEKAGFTFILLACTDLLRRMDVLTLLFACGILDEARAWVNLKMSRRRVTAAIPSNVSRAN
jgi:hypothetical protein